MGASKTRLVSESEKLDWLRLIRSENVGPITFFRLLALYGSASEALSALPELARKGGRTRRIRIASVAQAEQEMKTARRIGARILAHGEDEYPPLLSHIDDAPPLLYVLGHTSLLAKAAVAVVGARNASVIGQKFANDLSLELGRGGLLVVSGLARGIDAAAHAGALESGTAAVLGGGVDVIYPRENQNLYASIRERGVLVSEVPPGTVPQARHFPRRNRILSGISRGTVVVEASPRSGSLITARLALEQGREVFAVPGSPLDPRARGTNRLLREGAVLTESAADVLDVLGKNGRPLAEPREPAFAAPASPQTGEPELDSARAKIAESLGPVPVTVDEVIRNCQFSPAVASVVLLEMELAGRLERHPGNKISLIAAD
ncbi:MAG: DNA-processing protein DprA [Rhodospirillales bacterium]|nr:DNA-processing protein DprA [Rhodospirillales bacterium]